LHLQYDWLKTEEETIAADMMVTVNKKAQLTQREARDSLGI